MKSKEIVKNQLIYVVLQVEYLAVHTHTHTHFTIPATTTSSTTFDAKKESERYSVK